MHVKVAIVKEKESQIGWIKSLEQIKEAKQFWSGTEQINNTNKSTLL